MLRRNFDTKAGLVNGASGTVVAISATQITIKFDHATDPYKIERVKSAFMVMKITTSTALSFHSFWPMQ